MPPPDLDSLIAESERKFRESKEAADRLLSQQQADDRSLIAKLIVWSFVVLIAFVVLAAVGSTIYFHGWEQVAEPAKYLMTVLSSVMLPVVTLVIGYYFGSKQ